MIKPIKSDKKLVLALAAVCIFSLPAARVSIARADDNSISGQDVGAPGELGQKNIDHADRPKQAANPAGENMDDVSNHAQQAGTVSTTKTITKSTSTSTLRQLLGQHTIVIESSLMSALDQVKGVRAQYDLAANKEKASKEAGQMAATMIDPKTSVGPHVQELDGDLKSVSTHQAMLSSGASQFVKINSSDQYGEMNTAIDQVKSTAKSWQGRAMSKSYWQNREMVMSDLESLEKQLTMAIDKTKSFNSDKLDIKAVA